MRATCCGASETWCVRNTRHGAVETDITPAATFRSTVPQYRIDVDRVKTQTLNVSVDQVFSALAAYLGSSYVDQFNKFGRVFQIYVPADSQFRLRTEDIQNLTM